jgi:hypothetical protein
MKFLQFILSIIGQILIKFWVFIQPASTFIALMGLIYQIWVNLNSKRAFYKLELQYIWSRTGNTNKYIVTIRNTGNRAIDIEKVGFVKKANLKDLMQKTIIIYPLQSMSNIRSTATNNTSLPFRLDPKDLITVIFNQVNGNYKDDVNLTVQEEWQKSFIAGKPHYSKDQEILLAAEDTENRIHIENIKKYNYKFNYWRNRLHGYKGFKDSIFKY